MKCKYAFTFLGYERIARNHNVGLVNLSDDKSEKVEVKAGDSTFHFRVPNTIKNADVKNQHSKNQVFNSHKNLMRLEKRLWLQPPNLINSAAKIAVVNPKSI